MSPARATVFPFKGTLLPYRATGVAPPGSTSSPLQGASAPACADRSAGEQHAARNPRCTL